MDGIGFAEWVVFVPAILIAIAIPIATLVLVCLIYGKLKGIEDALNQRG